MYLIETYFRLTALENNIESQSRLLNAVIDGGITGKLSDVKFLYI